MFSERLKKIRIKNLLTQKELANKLNLKQATINKYEKGTIKPGYDTIIQLCKLFDCSADYLLGLKEDDLNDS